MAIAAIVHLAMVMDVREIRDFLSLRVAIWFYRNSKLRGKQTSLPLGGYSVANYSYKKFHHGSLQVKRKSKGLNSSS